MGVETNGGLTPCRLCGGADARLKIEIRIGRAMSIARVCGGCLGTAERTLARAGFTTSTPASAADAVATAVFDNDPDR